MQRWAWLIAGLVLAGLLLCAVIVAVVLSRREVALLPADTPSGVVQRFLQAAEAQDYRQAFGYLTTTDDGDDVADGGQRDFRGHALRRRRSHECRFRSVRVSGRFR